ncbi:MAG: DUF1320 domain-containing protein [Phycisphaerales bacterium]|nr:DUF1320 domain-containing protein [Phycisphaerales bacterium]
MSYATHADLEGRLGTAAYVQLTDDVGSGVADVDKASVALREAEGEVNSFLGRRYAVPVDAGGQEALAALLRAVTLDIAEYRLHARRLLVPDAVTRKREAALAWLRRVASGEAVLPAVRELPRNAAEGIGAGIIGPERIMSREELEGL